MKRSITKKIILSYIIIILFCLTFTATILSIYSKSYLEKKVAKNLQNTAQLITETLKDDLGNLRKDGAQDGYTAEGAKILLDIRAILKKRVIIQGSSYGIVTRDNKIFYPNVRNTEEYERFKNYVLPSINDLNKSKKYASKKIIIDGVEHLVAVVPINLNGINNLNAGGAVILYTQIGQINELGKSFIYLLFIALIFTGFVALAIGIFIARSIARPIIQLKNRAELLSARDFDTKIIIETGDEIQDLAVTFNKMALSLKEYDIGQKKFLQNASHELKTPLMSISGYAEGLKDGVIEDSAQGLDIIIEESARLNKLVEELIYLSKLETMEDYYVFQKTLINEIIEKSVEKVNSLSIKNNKKINIALYKDAKLSLDKDKITQALINLLGNCIRYANSEILITTVNDGKNLQVIISDDGQGFDEAEITRVFDRFYKGKKGNTGLGLAITKVIIEKHGGTISAHNKCGAEFVITFPLN